MVSTHPGCVFIVHLHDTDGVFLVPACWLVLFRTSGWLGWPCLLFLPRVVAHIGSHSRVAPFSCAFGLLSGGPFSLLHPSTTLPLEASHGEWWFLLMHRARLARWFPFPTRRQCTLLSPRSHGREYVRLCRLSCSFSSLLRRGSRRDVHLALVHVAWTRT